MRISKSIDKKTIIDRVSEEAETIVREFSYELVEVTFSKEAGDWYLRVFVDGSGGVDLNICAEISRRLGGWLDQTALIDRHYYLEISSPGIERPLKKRNDFIRFSGRKARITTFEPIAGKRRHIGILESLEGDLVVMRCEQDRIMIPLTAVASARLVFDPDGVAKEDLKA